MQTVPSAREAKEFLIGRIVSQAQHDGVGLSDIERKMLYFSETGWTLAGMMEINAQFESEYDSGEFEKKIGRIVRSIQQARARDKGEIGRWNKAVAVLRKEDHYLLILIDSAGSVRPRGDFIKLVLSAMAIVGVVLVVALYLADR